MIFITRCEGLWRWDCWRKFWRQLEAVAGSGSTVDVGIGDGFGEDDVPSYWRWLLGMVEIGETVLEQLGVKQGDSGRNRVNDDYWWEREKLGGGLVRRCRWTEGCRRLVKEEVGLDGNLHWPVGVGVWWRSGYVIEDMGFGEEKVAIVRCGWRGDWSRDEGSGVWSIGLIGCGMVEVDLYRIDQRGHDQFRSWRGYCWLKGLLISGFGWLDERRRWGCWDGCLGLMIGEVVPDMKHLPFFSGFFSIFFLFYFVIFFDFFFSRK